MLVVISAVDKEEHQMPVRDETDAQYGAHRDSLGPIGGGSGNYNRFLVSVGIESTFGGLEIDNCEISGFSHPAIYLRECGGHHIHHNY